VDGARPVRLALAIEVADLLKRYGYRQPAGR
jgi:hypothetical protein